MDDDDTQDYVSATGAAFARTFRQIVRNETLEEVAQAFDAMKNFGDTSASFAVYVRSMKSNAKT
jgi:hypothetical protein